MMVRSSDPPPMLVSGTSAIPALKLQHLRARISARTPSKLALTSSGNRRPGPSRNVPGQAVLAFQEEGVGEFQPHADEVRIVDQHGVDGSDAAGWTAAARLELAIAKGLVESQGAASAPARRSGPGCAVHLHITCGRIRPRQSPADGRCARRDSVQRHRAFASGAIRIRRWKAAKVGCGASIAVPVRLAASSTPRRVGSRVPGYPLAFRPEAASRSEQLEGCEQHTGDGDLGQHHLDHGSFDFSPAVGLRRRVALTGANRAGNGFVLLQVNADRMLHTPSSQRRRQSSRIPTRVRRLSRVELRGIASTNHYRALSIRNPAVSPGSRYSTSFGEPSTERIVWCTSS